MATFTPTQATSQAANTPGAPITDTQGNQGTATFNPMTGAPLTTLNANDLNSPGASPFVAPTGTTSGTSSAQNALGAHVTPAQQTINDSEQSRSGAMDTLLGLEQNAPNAAAETLNYQNQYGVPADQKELDDIQNQIYSTNQSYDSQIQNEQLGATGAMGGAVKANAAGLAAEKNNALAVLDIRKSVLTDNISRLNTTIDLMVKANTDASQTKINAMKDYISNIDADPATKEAMTEKAAQAQSQLDEVKTTYESIVKNAANNNAPTSVLNAINKAAQDPNATAATITAAAGQYAEDPTVALARQKAETSKAVAASTIAKNYADIANEQLPASAVSDLTQTLSTFNGQPYVTPTDLEGYSVKQKADLMKAMKQSGIKTLSAKDADTLSSINGALSDTASLASTITSLLPKNAAGQPLQLASVTWNKFLQTNPQLASFQTWQAEVIPILGALKGSSSGGGSGSARLFSTFANMLPQPTDTLATALQKIQNINTLLQNGGNAIMGTQASPTASSGGTVQSNGKSYTIGQVYQDGSGSKWTVDAQGKWTKQ